MSSSEKVPTKRVRDKVKNRIYQRTWASKNKDTITEWHKNFYQNNKQLYRFRYLRRRIKTKLETILEKHILLVKAITV